MAKRRKIRAKTSKETAPHTHTQNIRRENEQPWQMESNKNISTKLVQNSRGKCSLNVNRQRHTHTHPHSFICANVHYHSKNTSQRIFSLAMHNEKKQI